MDSVPYLNIVATVAASAFFAAFVLTFRVSKVRTVLATTLYGIGMMACLGPHAYFRFVMGATRTFGRFPTLEWLTPSLLLCFGIVATLLLWPSIPQKVALICGAVLFLGFAPLFIFLKIYPEYVQVHRLPLLDLTWFVYAILWFRIRESYRRQVAPC